MGVRLLFNMHAYLLCHVTYLCCELILICVFFFFQAEDGIRDLVRSRGLGDVYKRQLQQLGYSHFPQLRSLISISEMFFSTTKHIPAQMEVTKTIIKGQYLQKQLIQVQEEFNTQFKTLLLEQ